MIEKQPKIKKSPTVYLVRAGVICALYIALSFITFPISGGAIQFRLGEGLALIPIVFIESIPALTVGCLAFNFICGLPLLDVFVGTAITLVSATLTYFTGKMIKTNWLKVTIGGIFPTLLNAFLLPLIWVYLYGVSEYVYIIQALMLTVGEGLAVYLIGVPLCLATKRLNEKGII